MVNSSIKVEINQEGLKQLNQNVAASIQQKGVDISCIYCGCSFNACSSHVECPHCKREFDIEFKL